MCWSTVIADADAHAAFGDAPDNGWVQRCRLESGHAGLHGSDAGTKPFNTHRLWLQWVDEQSGHRLIELAPCPGADGTDSACSLFANHGGPHRFAPTTSTLRFEAHYEPDTRVSRNGSRRAGSVATASESVEEHAHIGQTSRHLEESAPDDARTDVGSQWRPSAHRAEQADRPTRGGRAANRAPDLPPTVDEALLAVAEALAELSRAIRRRSDTAD